jgi:Ser/Thr protein kinase RdoA (MazF antagonist)
MTGADESVQMGLTALSRWDFSVNALSLLKVRENVVFRADTDRGPMVVRVHRVGYHKDDALQSELSWLRALDQAGIGVPRLVRSTNARDFELLAWGDSIAQVDVFEWITGAPLGDVRSGIEGSQQKLRTNLERLGTLSARIHAQSQSWHPPQGFKRHAWDADGLAGESPIGGRFWELNLLDASQKRLLCRARDVIYKRLAALSRKRHEFSLIHADLVPENVLATSDSMHIIDFDDCGYGWHGFDIATVLYFLRPLPDYEIAKEALVSAYCKVRGNESTVLDALPLFTAARATTYLGWLHSRGYSSLPAPAAYRLDDFTVIECHTGVSMH